MMVAIFSMVIYLNMVEVFPFCVLFVYRTVPGCAICHFVLEQGIGEYPFLTVKELHQLDSFSIFLFPCLHIVLRLFLHKSPLKSSVIVSLTRINVVRRQNCLSKVTPLSMSLVQCLHISIWYLYWCFTALTCTNCHSHSGK